MSQKLGCVLVPLQFLLLFLPYLNKGSLLNLLKTGKGEEEVSRDLIGPFSTPLHQLAGIFHPPPSTDEKLS